MRKDSWVAGGLLAIAAGALAQAVDIANGALNPTAIGWLSVAIICCALACVVRSIALISETVLAFLCAAVIAFELTAHFTEMPGIYLRLAPDSMLWHHR